MDHRFVLEPYKGRDTRHTCPKCQAKGNTFVRYIDTQTGEHIAPNVGKCNRLDKCGYHYPPKVYFQDNNFSPGPALAGKTSKPRIEKTRPISFFPFDPFKESLQGYERNNFVKFLKGFFGETKTKELIEKYFIGTSKHWKGSTVFYQIDRAGKIRTGKIMLYCPNTGKRIKEPSNYITWSHKALNLPGFNLKQCLFGEHLLKDSSKVIA